MKNLSLRLLVQKLQIENMKFVVLVPPSGQFYFWDFCLKEGLRFPAYMLCLRTVAVKVFKTFYFDGTRR